MSGQDQRRDQEGVGPTHDALIGLSPAVRDRQTPMAPSLSPRTSPAAPPAGATERIRPSADVEVWCRSLNTWSAGFVALDVSEEGWRVMRRSDRSVLPVRFSPAEIRPARSSRRSRTA